MPRPLGSCGASLAGCAFTVPPVDPTLVVRANRELLLAAVANLLQNLQVHAREHRSDIERLCDRGIGANSGQGSLRRAATGSTEKLFAPFTQLGNDRCGLGLGLSVARQSVEAEGGTLTARDAPEVGCVLTISLPRQPASHDGPSKRNFLSARSANASVRF